MILAREPSIGGLDVVGRRIALDVENRVIVLVLHAASSRRSGVAIMTASGQAIRRAACCLRPAYSCSGSCRFCWSSITWYRAAAEMFVLLVASLFFYAWGQLSGLLLLPFSIGVNYLVGRGIDRAQKAKRVRDRAAPDRHRLQSSAARHRQVHVLRAGQPELAARRAGRARIEVRAVRADPRHFLLHLPRHLLSRRHLPQASGGAGRRRQLRALHRAVSPADRRADHPLSGHRRSADRKAGDRGGPDRRNRPLHRRPRRRSCCSPTSSPSTPTRRLRRMPARCPPPRHGSASSATWVRSISISRVTRTWREDSAGCSAFASSTISIIPTWPSRSRSSGAAGTSRCRTGSAITCTSRSAATGSARAGRSPICSSCSCCAASGTAPTGISSSGAFITARSSSLERLSAVQTLLDAVGRVGRHAYLLLVVALGWVLFRSRKPGRRRAVLPRHVRHEPRRGVRRAGFSPAFARRARRGRHRGDAGVRSLHRRCQPRVHGRGAGRVAYELLLTTSALPHCSGRACRSSRWAPTIRSSISGSSRAQPRFLQALGPPARRPFLRGAVRRRSRSCRLRSCVP